MASVIVALRVMPSSPSVDLGFVEKRCAELISGFGGRFVKAEVAPVAFGLNSLTVHFVMKEEIGSTEPLEKSVASVEGVNSAEVVDVRRAVG
ncbi:elongation factor 1-beta [Candidatus Woesearchaeota archaeon]|nr:elongation factor 1-beta [Candidatus Woesearchaeota archaeon]